MPRLFTAVRLTDRAQHEIDEQRGRLLGALDETQIHGLRLVRRDQLHITLVFIGQTPNERAADFIHACREPIAQPRFRVSFGGMGVFPPRGSPSVLWMGVAEGAEPLVDLHRAVVTRLLALGVDEESRPFRPHVTLGRWKRGTKLRPPRFAGDVGRRVGIMDVTHVTLFESRVSSSGSSYAVLAEAPLVDSQRLH